MNNLYQKLVRGNLLTNAEILYGLHHWPQLAQQLSKLGQPFALQTQELRRCVVVLEGFAQARGITTTPAEPSVPFVLGFRSAQVASVGVLRREGDQQLRLTCGELSAQEMRAVKSVRGLWSYNIHNLQPPPHLESSK